MENAASIAGMILTTEALITDKPEEKSGCSGHAGRHGLLVHSTIPQVNRGEGGRVAALSLVGDEIPK